MTEFERKPATKPMSCACCEIRFTKSKIDKCCEALMPSMYICPICEDELTYPVVKEWPLYNKGMVDEQI